MLCGDDCFNIRRSRFVFGGISHLPPQLKAQHAERKRAGDGRSARDVPHCGAVHAFERGAQLAFNDGKSAHPRELGRYGLSRAASMSAYGLLQGMAMPMLYFPSSFLTSFASLLIPKTAREFELSHRRAVRHITQRAVHAALQFGIFCSGIFFVFGSDWGEAFIRAGKPGHTSKFWRRSYRFCTWMSWWTVF